MDVSWVHRLNAVTQIRRTPTLITIIKAKQSEIRPNHRSDNFWTYERYKARVIFLGRKLVHSLFMALNKFPHHAASVQRNLPAVFSKDQLLGPDLGLVFHVYQACSSVCQLLNALFVLTGLQRLDGQRLRRHDSDLSRFLKKSSDKGAARGSSCGLLQDEGRLQEVCTVPLTSGCHCLLMIARRRLPVTCPIKQNFFSDRSKNRTNHLVLRFLDIWQVYYSVLIYQ